jgi:1-acyl-sn-glycerol-3-phosphate acyltransferase
MLSSGRTAADVTPRWMGDLPGATGVRVAQRAAGLVFSCLQAIGRDRASGQQPRSTAERAFAMHQLCAEVCRAHAFEIHNEGRPPEGAAVMVANHLSYLDPIMVAARKPLALIGKLEVEKWPLLGECGRRHGVLFIDRGNAHAGAVVLKRALRVLRAGVPVLNFPEGTTTDGDAMLPFKRGSFGLARLAKVPIVPVAIGFEASALHWVGDALFLPHYLRTAARTKTHVHVYYGEPMDVPRGMRADVVARAAHARLTTMIDEMKERAAFASGAGVPS